MGIQFNGNDPLYLKKVGQQQDGGNKGGGVPDEPTLESDILIPQTLDVDPDVVMKHLAASAAVSAPTGEYTRAL